MPVPRRLVELQAECSAVAARDLQTTDVDIQCLNDKDVHHVIEALLIEAKINDLVAELRRAAVPASEATRRLAEAVGLPQEAAAALLTSLDLQDPDAAATLAGLLRIQLGIAVGALRVSTAAEGLQRRSKLIFQALGAGETIKATREIHDTAAAMDTLVGGLDPGRDIEGLVSAASLVRSANDLLEQHQPQEAEARLRTAADKLPDSQNLLRATLLARMAELALPISAGSLPDVNVLFRAAQLYREAAAMLSRSWVMANTRRASALTLLGERKGDEAVLREAANELGVALHVLDPEAAPGPWMIAQRQLGTTLMRLGEETGDGAILDSSAAAFEAVIERTDRDANSEEWARLQVSLTSTLSIAAERTSDPERLHKAVSSFEPLLETVTRERDADLWRKIQHNRALVLAKLARTERNVGTMREAVTGFEQALTVVTPEADFEGWIRSKDAAADGLATLGTWRRDQTALTKAVEGYGAAKTMASPQMAVGVAGWAR
jgi:tetratricopeptide (TPR) repeat protein